MSRDSKVRYRQREAAKARAQGLCIDCWKVKAEEGFKTCGKCRASRRLAARRRGSAYYDRLYYCVVETRERV